MDDIGAWIRSPWDRPYAGWCTKCEQVVQLVGLTALFAEHPKTREITGNSYFAHLLGQCPACFEGIHLLERVLIDYHGNIDAPWGTTQVYPPRLRRIPDHLPPAVEAVYKEAVACEAAQVPMAAATMIGRVLEEIGADADIKFTNLVEIIPALVKEGIISKRQGETGKQVRLLRNDGAHPRELRPTQQDVERALVYLDTLCRSIYETQHLAQALESRPEGREVMHSAAMQVEKK